MRNFGNNIVVRRGAAYDTLSAPNAKGEVETVDFGALDKTGKAAKANQRQAVIDEVQKRLEAKGFYSHG